MVQIIYALRHPETGAIRYIGKANNLSSRLARHEREATSNAKYHKARWLRQLHARGLRPLITPLFSIPPDMSWQTVERFFIAAARSFGLQLTNETLGGEGWDTGTAASVQRSVARLAAITDPAYRKRHSEIMRVVGADPAYRAKLSEAHRARWAKPGAWEKLVAAKKTDAFRAGQSSNQREKWNDEEYRKRLMSTLRTEEFRKRQSDLARAAHARPEIKEKRAKLLSSPEYRAMMSVRMRAHFQRKREAS